VIGLELQQLMPLVSTIFIAISGILVAIGWYMIMKGRRETHQRFMVAGATFALLFFIVYVSKTVFIGSTQFGGPEHIKQLYLIFLLVHILLATTAAVFGIITLYLASKQRFVKHRKIGRITATIWMITAPTGILVYILLYVLYPGGETGSLIDAIIG
jgi:putative membrane protein